MPARAPRFVLPPKLDDPHADLEAILDALGPDAVKVLAEHLPPDELADIERLVASRKAEGWRAHPAAMAAHLNDGVEAALWDYVVLLSRKFAGAFTGTENPHQIWNIPSQYGKTSLLMRGVVWALDFNPKLRIMYVSYDANKAVEEGGNARDWAVEHSADLRFTLRSDRKARGLWRTDQGGGLYCVGINGGITGYPQDAVLLDDLVKGWEAAQSKAIRDAAWNVYSSSIRMRVQGPSCPIIDAGTTWHEDDIHARLRKDAAENEVAYQWEHIRLPATAEAVDPEAKDPLLRVPDPLGREPGEVLEPERFDAVEVASRRATLGSQQWAAVEQQRPTPQEGNLLKRFWWKRYASAPPRFEELLSSWDTKLKDSTEGDFTVGQVWGRSGANVYGLAQVRGQWGMDVAKVAVAMLKLRWPMVGKHVIENGGYGPDLKKELERAQLGYEVSDETCAVLGISMDEREGINRILRRGIQGVTLQNVKGGKEARALLQQPKLEAGNVWLPEGAAWADGLIDEAAAFPKGAHDDQVDAWSQALKRLDGSSMTTVASPAARRPAGVARPAGRR